VGYENITDLLNGKLALNVILALCGLKFLSWAIALGSGTSGGTLAPLLTIGGACGSLIGLGLAAYFPSTGISVPLAALIGMSAMFAGASRALLTSIVFALETSAQPNALLPLLAGCVISYFISFFLMKNTIMTEKIARRGVRTPHSYEPDILEKISVSDILPDEPLVLGEENTVRELRDWLEEEEAWVNEHFIVANAEGEFLGILDLSALLRLDRNSSSTLKHLPLRKPVFVTSDSSLRTVVETMAKENTDSLPVISGENRNSILGIVSHRDILTVYKSDIIEQTKQERHISLKRRGLRILSRGQHLIRRSK
jgi:CBS domain-containing protein